MVFYSKNSSKKIFHLPHCAIVKNMRKDNRRQFETPEEARSHGYRLCNCCAPVGQRLRKERPGIAQFSQEHGIMCYLHDGQLVVTTPWSMWKVVTIGKTNILTLYHRNTIEKKKGNSPIPDYHYQKARKNSILGYLDYIVQHDYFRMHTPLYVPPKPAKPRKGTKRWKAEQEKKKRIAKRKAVQNVYAILATLQTYA